MDRKNIIITLIVVLAVAGLLAYRYLLPDPVAEETATTSMREEQDGLHVASSTITYDVPGNRTHTIRFTVFVDEENTIRDFEFIDTTDPEHQENVDEFQTLLFERVEGRRLDELEPIDKVGTSTLTTGAFNEALVDIKAQL